MVGVIEITLIDRHRSNRNVCLFLLSGDINRDGLTFAAINQVLLPITKLSAIRPDFLIAHQTAAH